MAKKKKRNVIVPCTKTISRRLESKEKRDGIVFKIRYMIAKYGSKKAQKRFLKGALID